MAAGIVLGVVGVGAQRRLVGGARMLRSLPAHSVDTATVNATGTATVNTTGTATVNTTGTATVNTTGTATVNTTHRDCNR